MIGFGAGLGRDKACFWSNHCAWVHNSGGEGDTALCNFMVPATGCGRRAAGSVLDLGPFVGVNIDQIRWVVRAVTSRLSMGRAEMGPGLFDLVCQGF